METKKQLFGMDPKKGRWIFVLIGISINLCLGSIYAWSVFSKPLEEAFNIGATESLLPFIVFLATIAIVMPFAGGPLDRYGPKKLIVLGALLAGAGWLLGSMATNIETLTLTYGIIGGIGVGLVYNCPIGVAGRWFPDRRGFATGATILGFGLSPFITAPLANSWIEEFGVLPTFRYFGLLYIVFIIPLGLLLSFPPKDWNPGTSVKKTVSHFIPIREMKRSEMVRTKEFWGLWICFIISTFTGLMAVGICSPVGQEVFALDATAAAWFIGIFAIFNGIGRPVFGHLVDRTGARTSALISFFIIFSAALLIVYGASSAELLSYTIGFSALWMCLGGWLAIAPASTAHFFGIRHYGQNYGLINTAYGVGAVAGNLLAGEIRDTMGSYISVFYPVAVLALSGACIAFFLMKKKDNSLSERAESA